MPPRKQRLGELIRLEDGQVARLFAQAGGSQRAMWLVMAF
jgi:hypothetical protein